ncbi:MAG: uL15 family ribosomal protein [Bacillales bacterium]|jgi:hypothetical protein|nr:uL15 family ribosomal protein [Bacillales bacterium]
MKSEVSKRSRVTSIIFDILAFLGVAYLGVATYFASTWGHLNNSEGVLIFTDIIDYVTGKLSGELTSKVILGLIGLFILGVLILLGIVWLIRNIIKKYEILPSIIAIVYIAVIIVLLKEYAVVESAVLSFIQSDNILFVINGYAVTAILLLLPIYTLVSLAVRSTKRKAFRVIDLVLFLSALLGLGFLFYHYKGNLLSLVVAQLNSLISVAGAYYILGGAVVILIALVLLLTIKKQSLVHAVFLGLAGLVTYDLITGSDNALVKVKIIDRLIVNPLSLEARITGYAIIGIVALIVVLEILAIVFMFIKEKEKVVEEVEEAEEVEEVKEERELGLIVIHAQTIEELDNEYKRLFSKAESDAERSEITEKVAQRRKEILATEQAKVSAHGYANPEDVAPIDTNDEDIVEINEVVVEEVVEPVEEVEEDTSHILPEMELEEVVIEPEKEKSALSVEFFEEVAVKPHKIKSFIFKVRNSDEEIKARYAEIKNAIMAYSKIKAKLSKACETFKKGVNVLVKMNLIGKTLKVFFNLDPDAYPYTKYYQVNVGDQTKYKQTPFCLRVKSERGVKYALELVEEIMEQNNYERNPNYTPVNFVDELGNVEIDSQFILEDLGLDKLLRAVVDETYASSKLTDGQALKLLRPTNLPQTHKEGETFKEISVTLNLSDLALVYEPGDVVSLESLLERKLVKKTSNRLNIQFHGTLDKPLNIVADQFSMSAIKAIVLTGGNAYKVEYTA